MDVAPSQMVGVSAGLIPFLEHDDANRALMGSNMQRQAVPLLVAEPPIVGTGMEREVANTARWSSVPACRQGHLRRRHRIEIGSDHYDLKKYHGLNERTCQNQKPIVKIGDKVEKGQIIADGAATKRRIGARPQRAGRLHVVRRLQLRRRDHHQRRTGAERYLHSIHIEDFDVEIRETKLGREEFTRDIPNVSEKALRNLDDTGIVRSGPTSGPATSWSARSAPRARPS
jgi:DNA-directed RNA polymerase subunit beta